MGRLHRISWHAVAVPAIVMAGVGLAVVASATSQHMARLPSADRFGCRNCHVASDPVAEDDTSLNPFGRDFAANQFRWNADLALLDSDQDGCLNGIELGDANGDGNLDGNVHEETGNPGEADECGGGALVDEVTWGALKSLFDDN